MKTEVRTFSDQAAWVEAAADIFFQSAQQAMGARRVFTVTLSGGKTPLPLYECLGRQPYRQGIDWKSVHLFWGDERCVPFDDPHSNYGMARETLLGRVPLPPENVHPIPVSPESCPAAADRYEQDLRRFFERKSRRPTGERREPEGSPFPVFDLIMLGLGKDGHTASLFPGSPALAEQKRWALYIPASPQPPLVPRITMTLPVINRARTVLFLVSGNEKKETWGKIRLAGRNLVSPYPAARVNPGGKLIWLFREQKLV